MLSDEPAFDVLFCRNLLIYLAEPSRVQATSVLDRLLAPEGLLVIGHADRLNLTCLDPVFTPAGDHGAFTYRKTAAARPFRSLTIPSAPTSTWQGPQLPPPRPPMLLTWQPPRSSGAAAASPDPEDTRSGRDHRSSPDPGSQFPPRLQTASEAAAFGSLLDRASELANLGRHDEALALCEQLLKRQGPSAPAYYLMGVIHQSVGNRTKGEECLQKAVYLDPGHDEALLALALSAERRGDAALAAGFRRRAERAILRKGVR